jgi:hypothetical protein
MQLARRGECAPTFLIAIGAEDCSVYLCDHEQLNFEPRRLRITK